MKCEHAQEFFSEYIERTLDKPSVVALEAHLTACASCQRGMEALRQTWDVLAAVPEVEPPKDLAWKILGQLRQERLERLEAERNRPNPFRAWLQSLTPGAAFGYATLVALLFIAAAFPLRGAIQQVPFHIIGWDRPAPTAPPAPAASPAQAGLLFSVAGTEQDPQTGRWYYRLLVTSPADFGQARVTVNPLVMRNGGTVGTREYAQALLPNQPLKIPVPMAIGAERVHAISVHVEAAGGPMYHEIVPVTSAARPHTGM